MGSIVGKIAQMGANFIPGVGPLISGGIGAAMSAFGGSGSQGGQKGTSQQNTSQNIDQTQTTTEDPYMSSFRRMITGQVGQGLQDAKKPVYGDNETAGVLSQLNDLTRSSMDSLKANLGASGSQNSGRYLEGLAGGQNAYRQQAGSWLSQLPMLNRQYKDQQTQGLLGLGAGLAGHAPTSTKTTGTTTGSSTGSYSQTTQGPGFLKGLASNAGGFLGDLTGRLLNKGGGTGSSSPLYGWGSDGSYLN